MDVGTAGSEEALLLVQVLTVLTDDALRVEHHDVLLAGTDGHIELGARDGSGTGTVHHDFHLGNVLAVHLQGILQTGSRDDGCAVLVVVHDGDVERALQAVFDVEALRSLDVLEVDTAEGRSNPLHGFAELLRVFLVDLDVEHVDTAVNLEEQALALHHRFATHGTDVAQTEHCRAVGDNSHEIALVRIFIGVVRVLLDFQTGVGDTGGIR